MAQFSPALAQFGTVVSLPETTGGRRTQYAAELYSATGAMKSFKLASDALLDKQVVADLGEAGNALVDAAQARREAREAEADERTAASDELTLLRRQADILEAQLRIKKAQEALGPVQPEPEP